MGEFQIGDVVELRTSTTATKGTVIAVHRDSVRVTWDHRVGHEGKTTTERPQDLRKL